ncbi:10510_t:CDS:2, partial [Funneliformis geosporum]
MMYEKLMRVVLLISILVVAVSSQSSKPDPTPSPAPKDQPISLTNHVIKVGYMGTGYSQNNFTAGKGDVLYWEWEGELEHSVIESSPETPCVKKEGGIDLGVHKAPFNVSIAVEEKRTYVFFSDVSDDCKKGMYGGINLPQGYVWPEQLTAAPKQIDTPNLGPKPTEPTGSMTTMGVNAANAKATQSSTSYSPEISSTCDLTKPGYKIITGVL